MEIKNEDQSSHSGLFVRIIVYILEHNDINNLIGSPCIRNVLVLATVITKQKQLIEYHYANLSEMEECKENNGSYLETLRNA